MVVVVVVMVMVVVPLLPHPPPIAPCPPVAPPPPDGRSLQSSRYPFIPLLTPPVLNIAPIIEHVANINRAPIHKLAPILNLVLVGLSVRYKCLPSDKP
jgi:hypothetical protein